MMIKGKNMPFWKKRLIANSPLNSFFASSEHPRDNAMATRVNPAHHSGKCHQPGNSRGENFVSMFPRARQGRVMSIAIEVKSDSAVAGMWRLPTIQKPAIPMTRRAATA
jgi:hypothetical protein